MDFRRRTRKLSALLWLGVAACPIDVGTYAGRTCERPADCPEPYSCVAARPGLGRTCELLLPPALGSSSAAGSDYCEVKPVIDRTCISNCHGPDTSASGRGDFRLDTYENPSALQLGAKEMAVRVGARVADNSMPPPELPRPSPQERDSILRWANSGGPLALDGGTCAHLVTP